MIRIVTESMSDFTQEEAKAADLIVMPLPIRFGMEEYWDDGVSLTQDDFYARLRVAKELPKTSQVPVEHYRKCFNRLLENPEAEVLVITGSSKLSGCYQSACIAREACHDPARVTVLDSLNATCAEYMLVDQALRLPVPDLHGLQPEPLERGHAHAEAEDLHRLLQLRDGRQRRARQRPSGGGRRRCRGWAWRRSRR